MHVLAAKHLRVNGSNSYLGAWIIINTPHSISWGHSSVGLLEIIGLSLFNGEPNRKENEELWVLIHSNAVT